jgi:chromosome segregation ATPase
MVTNFIKTELKTRTMIVSHKENVVKNANSLIGASYVKAVKTSKVYSLDLRDYRE